MDGAGETGIGAFIQTTTGQRFSHDFIPSKAVAIPGFSTLEKVAHAGDSLLSLLRDGKLTMTETVTSGPEGKLLPPLGGCAFSLDCRCLRRASPRGRSYRHGSGRAEGMRRAPRIGRGDLRSG